MINFTAGVANIQAACTAAEVGTIVTSRGFVERARLDQLVDTLAKTVRFIYLEDLRRTVSIGDRISALFRYRRVLLPRNADEPAAILFTSGSEGTPKGVVLSHRNMLCNAAQAAARIDFGRTDKVFNTLPVFHAFGLTVGLVLPLVSGVPVFLYPSPCITASSPNWSMARMRRSYSAPIPFCPGTDARRTPTIFARCATCSRVPSRSRRRRDGSGPRNSGCGF